MLTPSNRLTDAVNDYVFKCEADHAPCSVDDILTILSNVVRGVLPPGETSRVELHHIAEHKMTIIITVPGNSDIAVHGPYELTVRVA